MEWDPLPLRWQLPPRTQGCSARTSPGICRHPSHPQGSPVMAGCCMVGTKKLSTGEQPCPTLWRGSDVASACD